jgi:hypothetical protein
MKKQNRNNIVDKQEQLIQDALRTGGFTFPQTVAEVEAFEKKFGTTDVSLPEHLKVPDFIAKGKSKKELKAQVIDIRPQDNFAAAAREGATKLSDDIQMKMREDRKKADEKYKKSNPKKK